jgi:hypothetical protein
MRKIKRYNVHLRGPPQSLLEAYVLGLYPMDRQ